MQKTKFPRNLYFTYILNAANTVWSVLETLLPVQPVSKLHFTQITGTSPMLPTRCGVCLKLCCTCSLQNNYTLRNLQVHPQCCQRGVECAWNNGVAWRRAWAEAAQAGRGERWVPVPSLFSCWLVVGGARECRERWVPVPFLYSCRLERTSHRPISQKVWRPPHVNLNLMHFMFAGLCEWGIRMQGAL